MIRCIFIKRFRCFWRKNNIYELILQVYFLDKMLIESRLVVFRVCNSVVQTENMASLADVGWKLLEYRTKRSGRIYGFSTHCKTFVTASFAVIHICLCWKPCVLWYTPLAMNRRGEARKVRVRVEGLLSYNKILLHQITSVCCNDLNSTYGQNVWR